MAKPIPIILLLTTVLYLFALVATVHAKKPSFHVEGEVYCDKCRAQFINRLTEPIPDATVRLECRDPQDEHNITFTAEGKTDKSGNYRIEVSGDHGDEVCQVVLVKSSREDCSEIPTETFEQLASKITLSTHTGMADKTRHASPLGFMVKRAIPECLDLYKELDMLPDAFNP